MDNILTFDIEEWFHANYDDVSPADYRGRGSRFRAQMDSLLQLCDDNGCKATFFVLGCIGEDYPDVVKTLAEQGHEVASHGYSHQLAYRQTREEFKADVEKSVSILENIIGDAIYGYRAPSWSIVESNLHYLAVLEELGLKYDASIFPVKTFLYGIPDAPTEIYKPVIDGREADLYEVPMSVTRFLEKNIGYSGGFYFRLFPEFWIKKVMRDKNQRGKNTIVYLHPRELDPLEQRLSLPLKEAFIHYYNVAGARAKLTDIMRSFRFTSIIEYLRISENVDSNAEPAK